MPAPGESNPKPGIALVSIFDATALGIRSIHAQLAAAGYPADLVLFREKMGIFGFRHRKDEAPPWPTAREYELMRELLAARRPRILGISLRSFAFKIAVRITELAREVSGSLVVWGGTHPTLMPEQSLEWADAVCIGEGEGAMLDLARALEAGQPIDGIPNLWVRERTAIRSNPIRPLIQDLDALAFPLVGSEGRYTIEHDLLLEKDVYLGPDTPVIYCVSGSRGCPYNCDFCCNSAFHQIFKGAGKYVRKRSPDNVIQELLAARQSLKVRAVAFQDEIFSMDREWGREFMAKYEQEIKAPFIIDLHPRTVDNELAAGARRAGLYVAHMGVQSGSEDSRRRNYNRQEKNEDVVAAARAFGQNRVICFFDFIFDNPYETSEDLRQTLELMLSLPRPHNTKILSLCYFPGTRITQRALADNKIQPEQVDHLSQKSFADIWGSYFNSIDPENAFYKTLAWMDTVKFHYGYMALTFFSDVYGDSFHLVPRWLIRRLSGSAFLRQRPYYLHYPFSLWFRVTNRVLVPIRLLRSAARLVISGRLRELIRRARARISG